MTQENTINKEDNLIKEIDTIVLEQNSINKRLQETISKYEHYIFSEVISEYGEYIYKYSANSYKSGILEKFYGKLIAVSYNKEDKNIVLLCRVINPNNGKEVFPNIHKFLLDDTIMSFNIEELKEKQC